MGREERVVKGGEGWVGGTACCAKTFKSALNLPFLQVTPLSCMPCWMTLGLSGKSMALWRTPWRVSLTALMNSPWGGGGGLATKSFRDARQRRRRRRSWQV